MPAGRFLDRLIGAGHLVPGSVAGLYGHGPGFAAVADAVGAALRQCLGQGAERLRLASVMPRADLERIGYFRNFPHLLGTVHCFCGDEAAHRTQLGAHEAGEDWTGRQSATDLVLIPAACYPVYPILARRGVVPAEGWLVNVEANCFRREPSLDPCRMQSFHMQELVHVGRRSDVVAFRDAWLERGRVLLSEWGLDVTVAAADDPFFGRTAVVMVRAQRDKALKFECLVQIGDETGPTACMSANYHMDSFGRSLGLRLMDGEAAHSACIGFGIERVTLALLHTHGMEPGAWPFGVRQSLRLEAE